MSLRPLPSSKLIWLAAKNSEEFYDNFDVLAEARIREEHFRANVPFIDALLEKVDDFMDCLVNKRRVLEDRSIDIEKIRPGNAELDIRTRVELYIELLKASGSPYYDGIFLDEYIEVLKQWAPRTMTELEATRNAEDYDSKVVTTFFKEEKSSQNGAASRCVWDKICTFNKQYAADCFAGPYTSIVGPGQR